jgi:hypothetical protein
MPAPSIDQLLAKARLNSPAYTSEELAAAQARLAAAATTQLLSGALLFDDATAPDLWSDVARPAVWGAETDWDLWNDADARDRQEAAMALHHMCKIVISQPEALHTMATFVSSSTGSGGDPSRILEPDGARVLACVLHLADRQDSARFWWQFAAGADDHPAKLCLLPHHLALGESHEARWWHQQVPQPGRRMWTRAILNGHQTAAANILNMIARLKTVPDAANAVVGYVKEAVQFVDDDIDLPLPADGFAARIEEITAGV